MSSVCPSSVHQVARDNPMPSKCRNNRVVTVGSKIGVKCRIRTARGAKRYPINGRA